MHTWGADRKSDRRELGRWPLPAGFDRTQEHTFEFRAVGDLLTISLNGQQLGTVRDSSATKGIFGFFSAKGAAIRKMEYVSLDQPAAATFNGHRYDFVPCEKGLRSWGEAKNGPRILQEMTSSVAPHRLRPGVSVRSCRPIASRRTANSLIVITASASCCNPGIPLLPPFQPWLLSNDAQPFLDHP